MKALVRTTPASAEAAGLLQWWLGELQELLPRGASARGQRRAALQLVLERPFVRVLARRGKALEQVGTFLLPETDEDGGTREVLCEPGLRRILDRHKDSTALVLGPDEALTCTDILPASAEGELGRIVAHKLDLLTPWPAERVYAAHRVAARRKDGTLEVLIAAAPRAVVDETRRRLAAADVELSAVDVALEDSTRRAEVDLLHAETPDRKGGGLLRTAGILLLVLALAGAGLAGWAIWQRHQQLAAQAERLAGLERQLAGLPALRERIQGLEGEAGFLANERRSRPSPLIVLEVLSRLLPDSVWLTDIRLDERELAIAGMAEDAAALIALIEGAPEFTRARFQTPSTRMRVATSGGGEREVERFAISAEVDPSVESNL